MANVAFVLETEIVALAPPLGLVVEQAARIEAEVAADSAVGAMGRSSDGRRRLGNRRIFANDRFIDGQIGKLHARADPQSIAILRDRGNVRNRCQVDHGFRRFDAAADIHDHIRPTGEVARGRIGGFQLDRLSRGIGPVQGEFGHVFHCALPYSAAERISRSLSSRSCNRRSGVTGSS